MSVHIQARKDEHGVLRYRFWATERDAYCGPAMSEEEARLDALLSRIEDSLDEIDSSLKHAAEHGTSVRDRRYWVKLTDPWEKELHHDDFPSPQRAPTPAEKEKSRKLRATLERLIATYLTE